MRETRANGTHHQSAMARKVTRSARSAEFPEIHGDGRCGRTPARLCVRTVSWPQARHESKALVRTSHETKQRDLNRFLLAIQPVMQRVRIIPAQRLGKRTLAERGRFIPARDPVETKDLLEAGSCLQRKPKTLAGKDHEMFMRECVTVLRTHFDRDLGLPEDYMHVPWSRASATAIECSHHFRAISLPISPRDRARREAALRKRAQAALSELAIVLHCSVESSVSWVTETIRLIPCGKRLEVPLHN